MENDPSNDLDKEGSNDRANKKEDSHAFATEIADYVKQREIEIKEEYNIKEVEKIKQMRK